MKVRGVRDRSARKRVVIVAPHYPEYSFRYAKSLSRFSDVLLILDGAQLDRELAGWEIETEGRELSVRTSYFRTLSDLVSIVLAVVRVRPRVLHLQEATGSRRCGINCLLAFIFSLLCRVVLTVHDPIPHSGSDRVSARKGAVARSIVRYIASDILLHGESCRREYASSVGVRWGQRLRVVQHGVLLSEGASFPDHRSSLTALTLLMIGRMEEYKGLEDLLDSIECDSLSKLELKLIVAGSGSELTRLAPRLEASPRVQVIDRFLRADEMVWLIDQCDVVVLPYRNASQSGIAAAAYGRLRPVLATNVGGLSDIVQDGWNGWLVEPRSPYQLSRCIARISSGDTRCSVLRGVWQTHDVTLDWDAIVDKMV